MRGERGGGGGGGGFGVGGAAASFFLVLRPCRAAAAERSRARWVAGCSLALARAPRFGLVFSRTFYGGFGRFFPGRGRAAAPQQQRWQLAPAVAVVPASGSVQGRVCIYVGFQLCVGLGFSVRRRGFFCVRLLCGVACNHSVSVSILFLRHLSRFFSPLLGFRVYKRKGNIECVGIKLKMLPRTLCLVGKFPLDTWMKALFT
jgi:hypothetical protein